MNEEYECMILRPWEQTVDSEYTRCDIYGGYMYRVFILPSKGKWLVSGASWSVDQQPLMFETAEQAMNAQDERMQSKYGYTLLTQDQYDKFKPLL